LIDQRDPVQAPSGCRSIESSLAICCVADSVLWYSRMQTDQAVPRPFSGSKWPYGDSVTAELIRTLDWASTSRGPIEDWTATQRIVTDLLLSSAFPMIALWGPDLTQIYNDGYLALMGDKHPAGMGQSTAACWPEVWSFNEPIYQRVRKSETVTFEDQLFPIYRHGFIEDAYFSLCYSPIYDELHDVAGILVSVTETTQRVRAVEARERMDTARKLTDATLALERKQLQQLFTQAPVFMWPEESGLILTSRSVLRGRRHIWISRTSPCVRSTERFPPSWCSALI
jgi:hypothetical protein